MFRIANNKGAGMSAGLPDVCLSPVLGLYPFPNLNPNALMFPFSFNVWFSMMPALNMASISPITLGDQLGTLHPTFMGPARHTIGDPAVHINFLKGTSLLCPRTGNSFNCILGVQVLPSLTNVVFGYSAGSAGGARSAGASMLADLDALVASLHPCGGEPSVVESAWLGPGVGYLRIRRFSLDVPARVHMAVRALEAEGLETLVLDLRGNPGGALTASLELAGDFLEPGSVLGRTIDADGDEVVYRSNHRNPCRAPLWLLVDRGTASAAELFAGCLQWHGRALVAGERTYGKGTALKVAADPADGAQVLAPAAMMVLPGGESIQATGVRPDVELAGSEAEGEPASLAQFFTRDLAEVRRSSRSAPV
ncbi:S41 family peptidase [Sorangium sp. So ce1182]|uniref:S41 family peptidase n=1 Tax=Sorangium sp. So ce1182 TaxID=3133334 RepID=UPI003F639EA5